MAFTYPRRIQNSGLTERLRVNRGIFPRIASSEWEKAGGTVYWNSWKIALSDAPRSSLRSCPPNTSTPSIGFAIAPTYRTQGRVLTPHLWLENRNSDLT